MPSGTQSEFSGLFPGGIYGCHLWWHNYYASGINSWAKNYNPDPESDFYNAWRIYEGAKRGAQNMGMLLLGETKIRQDPSLLANFGITSYNGIQDKAERQMATRAYHVRRQGSAPRPAAMRPGGQAPGRARKAYWAAPAAMGRGDQQHPQDHEVLAVLSHGSILSDRMWTPLVNDSYILGGIRAHVEFIFTEPSTELLRDAEGHRTRFNAAEVLGSTDQVSQWQSFFINNDLLWDKASQFPRVFARELIGLKTFGYKAAYIRAGSSQQLSFVCRDPERADAANFTEYQDALKNFATVEKDKQDEKNKQRGAILQELFSFLQLT